MLAPSDKQRCIECGRTYGTPEFRYYYGRIENGPAYWCDRGILCSPRCSLAHYRKRAAEGALPDRPSPDPFQKVFTSREGGG